MHAMILFLSSSLKWSNPAKISKREMLLDERQTSRKYEHWMKRSGCKIWKWNFEPGLKWSQTEVWFVSIAHLPFLLPSDKFGRICLGSCIRLARLSAVQKVAVMGKQRNSSFLGRSHIVMTWAKVTRKSFPTDIRSQIYHRNRHFKVFRLTMW
jgi:hypothetical protein